MHIIKRDEVEAFRTKDNSIIREIVNPRNSPGKNQSLAEATVMPGEKTQKHRHPEAEEIYYIIQGEGKINIGDETGPVRKWEAVIIPPDTPHNIENIGKNELVFLCCCSPPYKDKDFSIVKEHSRY